MKYAYDSRTFAALEDRGKEEDLAGTGIFLGGKPEWNRNVKTADCVAVLVSVLGAGTWKRQWKKKYDRVTYRAFSRKQDNRTVTVADDGNGLNVLDIDPRDYLEEIDAILAWCKQHMVEMDSGTVLYDPIKKRVFFCMSDCGTFYVENIKDKAEIKKNLLAMQEGGGFEDEPTIEDALDFVTDSLYGDEFEPHVAHGFLLIGATQECSDLGVDPDEYD